jgi:hypothetical protein
MNLSSAQIVDKFHYLETWVREGTLSRVVITNRDVERARLLTKTLHILTPDGSVLAAYAFLAAQASYEVVMPVTFDASVAATLTNANDQTVAAEEAPVARVKATDDPYVWLQSATSVVTYLPSGAAGVRAAGAAAGTLETNIPGPNAFADVAVYVVWTFLGDPVSLLRVSNGTSTLTCDNDGSGGNLRFRWTDDARTATHPRGLVTGQRYVTVLVSTSVRLGIYHYGAWARNATPYAAPTTPPAASTSAWAIGGRYLIHEYDIRGQPANDRAVTDRYDELMTKWNVVLPP